MEAESRLYPKPPLRPPEGGEILSSSLGLSITPSFPVAFDPDAIVGSVAVAPAVAHNPAPRDPDVVARGRIINAGGKQYIQENACAYTNQEALMKVEMTMTAETGVVPAFPATGLSRQSHPS